MENGGRRVIVGVDGSTGSLRALRCGVAEGRLRRATVYAVFAWTPPGGEVAERRGTGAHPRLTWETAAWERLHTSCAESLGEFPSDVDVRLLVAHGATGHALVNLADEESDLLVVGAGRRKSLRHGFTASVARYCSTHAACPVLVVPSTRTAAEAPAVSATKDSVR